MLKINMLNSKKRLLQSTCKRGLQTCKSRFDFCKTTFIRTSHFKSRNYCPARVIAQKHSTFACCIPLYMGLQNAKVIKTPQFLTKIIYLKTIIISVLFFLLPSPDFGLLTSEKCTNFKIIHIK